MKRILFIYLLPLTLFGQQLEEAEPATVQVSAERLVRIDDLMNSAIERGWIPGGEILVARKGKIVYHRSFGQKDQNNRYQNRDIYRIASMTKAITSVGIMQLYEQGKLGLDDPVHWYLPSFTDMTVLDSFNDTDSSFTTKPAKTPITIRHLLTHTAGIAYGDFYPGKIMVVYDKHEMLGVGLSHTEWNTEEFIDRLAEVPLAFEPGERFLYGLNIDVLGRIIEVISGQPLNQYFRTRIFDILGMDDTYFYLPRSMQSRLVPVYTVDENGKLILGDNSFFESIDYPKYSDNGHYAGGGGLSSTAIDYAKFIQALLNNGAYNGKYLLSPQTVDMLNEDQLIMQNQNGKGLSEIPGITFGLSFKVTTEDARGVSPKSPGTYEWGGIFNTKYFIDPEEELIFVGMTQVFPFAHEHFWDKLTTVIYGALED